MNATQRTVFEEIDRIAREEIALGRAVGPEDDLAGDLQLDSLATLTLVAGLENRFRIILTDEDAAGVRTVGDLAALVARRVDERAPAAAESGR